MTIREARCACGQVAVECQGDPQRISVCHCLDCQRRSGSAFAFQARWPQEQVAITGRTACWTKQGESGAAATFTFCADCGTTVAYRADSLPGLIAVPVGTFADPLFPAPEYSVYEQRMHRWVALTAPGMAHYD